MRFSSLISAALSFVSVVYAQQTNGQNSITFPLGGVLDASLPLTIKWTPTTKGTITIKLLKGPPTNILDIEVVAASVENTGTFTWTIPSTVQGTSSLPVGERYGLKIIDDSTGTFEYSPPFDVSAAPADPVPVAGPTAVTSVSSPSPSATASSISTDPSAPSSAISTSAVPPPTSVESPSTTAPAETPKSTNLSSPTPAPTASASETSLQTPLRSTTFSTETRTGTAAQSTNTQAEANDDDDDDDNDDKKSKSSSGPSIVLIAGVTAGVVGLGLVVVAVIVILKRRSKRRESAHIPMRERPSSLLSEGIYNKIKANE